MGGRQFGVDVGAVRGRARVLGTRSGDVVTVADRVGAALGQVASAVGAGSLQGAAGVAARAWGEGVSQVAVAGQHLAEATEATAQAYESLESRQVQRLDPGGSGR